MLGDVIKTTACVIGAGCAAVVAVHPVLGAIGFTVGGIAPGSIAATSMSIAAYWSGGGVTSGSLVALCQSIGAAGMGAAGKTMVAGAGAAGTALLLRK